MSIKIKVDINKKRYLVQLFILILKLQKHYIDIYFDFLVKSISIFFLEKNIDCNQYRMLRVDINAGR